MTQNFQSRSDTVVLLCERQEKSWRKMIYSISNMLDLEDPNDKELNIKSRTWIREWHCPKFYSGSVICQCALKYSRNVLLDTCPNKLQAWREK